MIQPLPYSGLSEILDERKMSVLALERMLMDGGISVNRKTLYELAKPKKLKKVDMTILGAIKEALNVSLDDLVKFESPVPKIEQFPAKQQEHLDRLLDKGSKGKLTKKEQEKLDVLIAATEELTLRNAKRLARFREEGFSNGVLSSRKKHGRRSANSRKS